MGEAFRGIRAVRKARRGSVGTVNEWVEKSWGDRRANLPWRAMIEKIEAQGAN